MRPPCPPAVVVGIRGASSSRLQGGRVIVHAAPGGRPHADKREETRLREQQRSRLDRSVDLSRR
eukprot:scaffold495_cov405-Prasinococcus_capsulatus_cf.AAC.11